MQECAPLISLGPLNNIILYLNKPKIIGNGRELSDLEYLPTKVEKVKYLQNAGTCTCHLFGPIYLTQLYRQNIFCVTLAIETYFGKSIDLQVKYIYNIKILPDI